MEDDALPPRGSVTMVTLDALKSVVQNVVKGQPADNYYHNGVTLDLGVTRSTIDKIFDKMEKLLWDDDIMIIAKVLGLRNLRVG